MPYRTSEVHTLCAVCVTASAQTCCHCDTTHCSEHLADGACEACTTKIKADEHRLSSRVVNLTLILHLVTTSTLLNYVGANVKMTQYIAFSALLLLHSIAVVIALNAKKRKLTPSSLRLPRADRCTSTDESTDSRG